jgi:hypothetical protein
MRRKNIKGKSPILFGVQAAVFRPVGNEQMVCISTGEIVRKSDLERKDFADCSSNLHNRTGTVEDYQKIRESVCAHLELKYMLQKIGGASK